MGIEKYKKVITIAMNSTLERDVSGTYILKYKVYGEEFLEMHPYNSREEIWMMAVKICDKVEKFEIDRGYCIDMVL